MSNSKKFALCGLALVFGVSMLAYGAASTQTLNLQGRITDSQGVPVSDAQPTLRIPEIVVGGRDQG